MGVCVNLPYLVLYFILKKNWSFPKKESEVWIEIRADKKAEDPACEGTES